MVPNLERYTEPTFNLHKRWSVGTAPNGVVLWRRRLGLVRVLSLVTSRCFWVPLLSRMNFGPTRRSLCGRCGFRSHLLLLHLGGVDVGGHLNRTLISNHV